MVDRPLGGKWALGFVVVRFDLEHGALVERQVPPAALTPQQQREISFLAFPDSSLTKGDCVFTFKTRDRFGSFIYGVTYFRQERDPTAPRGAIQTSVVLFTKWPFIQLYKRVVKLTAQHYYGFGSTCNNEVEGVARAIEQRARRDPVLESVLRQLGQWPDPCLDHEYELPLFGRRLKFKCPYFMSDRYADNSARYDVFPEHVVDPTSAPSSRHRGATLPVCASETHLGVRLPRRHSYPGNNTTWLSDIAELGADKKGVSVSAEGGEAMRRASSLSSVSSSSVIGSPPNIATVESLPGSPDNFEEMVARRQIGTQFRLVPPGSPLRAAHGWAQQNSCSPDRLGVQRPSVDASGALSASSSTIEEDFPQGLGREASLGGPAAVTPPTTPALTPSLCTDAHARARLAGRHYVFGDVNIYSCLKTQLTSLWKFWELMVLNKPIAVLTTAPNIASDIVLSIVSLLSPITFVGDMRPYFTVQDADFEYFCSLGKKQPFPNPIIVGVTNPYFAKAFDGWTNFAAVVKHPKALNPGGKKAPSGLMLRKNRQFSKRERLVWEWKECFLSEHKFIVADESDRVKEVLRSLLVPGNGVRREEVVLAEEVNNDVLRAHFLNFTEDFLQPLRACFNSIWAACKLPIMLIAVAALDRVFPVSEFISWVEKNGYVKSLFKGTRAEAIAFYTTFLMTPTFSLWLSESVYEAFKRELLGQTPKSVLSACTEEQRIDLYTLFNEQLALEQGKGVLDPIIIASLTRWNDELETSFPAHTLSALAQRVSRGPLTRSFVAPLSTQAPRPEDDDDR